MSTEATIQQIEQLIRTYTTLDRQLNALSDLAECPARKLELVDGEGNKQGYKINPEEQIEVSVVIQAWRVKKAEEFVVLEKKLNELGELL